MNRHAGGRASVTGVERELQTVRARALDCDTIVELKLKGVIG